MYALCLVNRYCLRSIELDDLMLLLFQHTFQTLTNARLQAVSQCSSNVQSLFNTDLPRILQERVPDTPGHTEVKEVCVSDAQKY